MRPPTGPHGSRRRVAPPHHEGLNASELPPHDPEREHGDADRDELQQHTQPHQLLRRIRRAAPHHVDEPHQKDEGDGSDGDGKEYLAQESSHCGYITPACAVRHAAKLSFEPTKWLLCRIIKWYSDSSSVRRAR